MRETNRAPKILQWGFDETKLDGVSTMNQWVLLQEGDNAPEVVTIEAAGLTVGGIKRFIRSPVECRCAPAIRKLLGGLSRRI